MASVVIVTAAEEEAIVVSSVLCVLCVMSLFVCVCSCACEDCLLAGTFDHMSAAT